MSPQFLPRVLVNGLTIKFEAMNARLNQTSNLTYLGRPKRVLDSAHVKFDV